MKNVLVLGGTGFVGGHVCEKLVRAGWQLTVPTRRWLHARPVLHLPATRVVECDVHDPAALAQLVAGQDAVVNLVAILHGTEAAFERTHVELPRKLASALLQAGLPRLVHVSAVGVDALQPESAPSMYLRSKGQGEASLTRAARETPGFDLTILRPSVIFGANDKFLNVFAKLQKALPLMPLAGAHTRFQPVWVEDVATAVVCCLQGGLPASPRVIEACGPEVFTLQELVQLAARCAGVRHGRGRPVLALPHWLGRVQARLMELAPGAPVMSRDNLDSMQVDNVASGQLPGLDALGIQAAALTAIAPLYLSPQRRF